MESRPPPARKRQNSAPLGARARVFGSELVDRIRTTGNVWSLGGGQLLLPEVFGFCRGVTRALTMLQDAVKAHRRDGKRIFLLGEIIHNPWVNKYFRQQGVLLLPREQLESLQEHITDEDCAVIPAFGVPLEVAGHLEAVGCEVIDTSCGDVRRLWRWAEQAVANGRAVLIFGHSRHDETVVTKSRLSARGGLYLVAESLREARRFCELIAAGASDEALAAAFGPEATNAISLQPFERLAQVSQTTMLYDETMAVCEVLEQAFADRFGRDELSERLWLQPTVCRATQNRQEAAIALCRDKCDLAVVVGGVGSSNTRHLYELARSFVPAVLIEGAGAIRSELQIECAGDAGEPANVIENWLPRRRPLRIAVLAGASCPEIVIAEVLQRLAQFLR